MAKVYIVSFVALIYIALPAFTIWGWIVWAKRRKEIQGVAAKVSLVGFTLATLAEILAAVSMAYAHSIGGFGANDARFFVVVLGGVILSLVALALACGGVARRSPLQWFSLGCSFGALVFWVAVAMVG